MSKQSSMPATVGVPVEIERYELRAAPAYRFAPTRRELFRLFGGGLLVLCLLPQAEAQESGGRQRGSLA